MARPARMAPLSKVVMAAAKKKSVGDLKGADLKGKKVKTPFPASTCHSMLGLTSSPQVLIRCDLNVPLDGKKITDDTRKINSAAFVPPPLIRCQALGPPSRP